MQEFEGSESNRSGATVSLDRACLELGISRRTLYYWIRAGRLRTIRTRGGSQRVVWNSAAAGPEVESGCGTAAPTGAEPARSPLGGVQS